MIGQLGNLQNCGNRRKILGDEENEVTKSLLTELCVASEGGKSLAQAGSQSPNKGEQGGN